MLGGGTPSGKQTVILSEAIPCLLSPSYKFHMKVKDHVCESQSLCGWQMLAITLISHGTHNCAPPSPLTWILSLTKTCYSQLMNQNALWRVPPPLLPNDSPPPTFITISCLWYNDAPKLNLPNCLGKFHQTLDVK